MSLLVVKPKTEEITLEDLKEDLEMLIWDHGKNSFILTENFLRTKKRSLVLDSLCLDIEYPYVIFYDHDNLILLNEFVSMMFLDSSIQKINKQTVGDKISYTITFSDGTITIE